MNKFLNYNYEFVPGWQINHEEGTPTYINIPLLTTIKRFKPNIIIVGGASIPSLFCLLYKAIFKYKMHIWWAGTELSEKDKNSLIKCFRKWLFKHVDGFFAYSHYSKKYLESFAINSSNIRVIGNNTIDSEKYGYTVRGSRSNKFLKPSDRFTILIVAQLVPRKNVITIIEAYSALSKKYPNLMLAIAGDGKEKQKLNQFCSANALANVRFLGNVQPENLLEVYKDSDVLINLSTTDQWPQVINEAMACGVPVIASITSGVDDDFLKEGINGYLIDPFDKKRLIEILENLIQKPDLVYRIGREAFQTASKHDVHTAVQIVESVVDTH